MKLMGERLQSVIIPLVHQNQYGFIKSRTIQDCLAWAFEYIHQCQQSKQEILIIKLDFTKAFDTIEHSTITLIMKQLYFSDSWVQWTASILGSASTSVLLNGVPGKSLNCRRGVRQGDPMPPCYMCLLLILFSVLSTGFMAWAFFNFQFLRTNRLDFLSSSMLMIPLSF
jgi:hypothetical protein